MITEDYVSFEIAKLLKEKGFDAGIDLWYNSDGEIFHLYHYDYTHNATKYFACVQCPTLQMVMKWLREVHNIFISIIFCIYSTEKTVTWIPEINTFDSAFPDSAIDCETYEEACEAAIKYCLENLI